MTMTRPTLGACFCISRPPSGGAGRAPSRPAASCSAPRRARADRARRRRVQQARERAEHLVRAADVLQQGQRRARHHDEAAADRPVRVLLGEHRRAVVVGPRGPEQEALLRARRVVGELVEQLVDDAERRRQPRRHDREVAGGRAQVADRRQHVARERPQLVLGSPASCRRRTGAPGAASARARGRPAAGRRASGRSSAPSASAFVSAVSRRVERAGQQPQRLAQRARPGRRTRGRRGWRSRRASRAGRPCRRAPRPAAGSCGSCGGCSPGGGASAPLSRASSRPVGSKRLSVRDSRRPCPPRPSAAAADEQLQVRARVGVERRRGSRRSSRSAASG